MTGSVGRCFVLFGILAVGAGAGGCCTVVHGIRQEIPIESDPPGAEVWIDGVTTTTTPAQVKLLRKRGHTVTISKPGYVSHTVQVHRTANAWLAGNAVTCGAGCMVDALTGAAYTLSPERICVTLVPLVPSLRGSPPATGEANHERLGGLSGDAPGVTYACPMDPEVVQASLGRCPRCGMELVRK